MRAFVTGGTGFVGSYLLHILAAQAVTEGGYEEVRVLVRPNSRRDAIAHLFIEQPERFHWVEGDLFDAETLEGAMDGVAHIYHIAALVSFDPADKAALIRTNVDGTNEVVNAALYKGVEKLGYVSSIAALGQDHTNTDNLNEEAKWRSSFQNSNYAVSKFFAEQAVWRGVAEGLDAVAVLPAVIVGSGNWSGGSPALVRQVAKGLRFYPLGSTGFVDVRDVARSLVQLVQRKDIHNERYILAGANHTYRDFFNAIAKALDVPAPSVAITPFVREVAWRAEWLRSRMTGKRSIITRETAQQSSRRWSYSSEKLLRTLPDFTFTPFDETIAATAAAYRATDPTTKQPPLLPLVK